MSTIARLRVHIAPVGFEEDRIILPAKEMRADRVWLLIQDNPSQDRARAFIPRITAGLKRLKIDVRQEPHDRTKIYDIVRALRDIMRQEAGNDVYVNLASGSKIQAIALMMGCMMEKDSGVRPFYAEAKSYTGLAKKQISSGIRSISDVPMYRMQVPRPELVSALNIIESQGGRLTKKRLAGLAIEGGIISVGARDENMGQASLSSLAQNIIRPLEEEWGYVRVEKIGRNRWVEITDEGRAAARMLGAKEL